MAPFARMNVRPNITHFLKSTGSSTDAISSNHADIADCISDAQYSFSAACYVLRLLAENGLFQRLSRGEHSTA